MSNQAAQALPGSALSMMSQFHDVQVPVEKMLPTSVHNSFDRQYRETFTARIKSHPAQSHRYFAQANFVCMQFDMTNTLK
jgi:molybdopterin biosynthesis enzyme